MELFIERQIVDKPFVWFGFRKFKGMFVNIYAIILLGLCFGIDIKLKKEGV